MESNNTIQNVNIKGIVIVFIISAIIGVGIFYWAYVIEPNKSKQHYREIVILQALNKKGYQYTDLSTFTKDDFELEEVVKSDYKPIYKITFKNKDAFSNVIYIGLLIPAGNNNVDSYSMGYTLEQVQKALNQ